MASLPFPQCNMQCPGEAPGSSPAEEEASRALPWGLTTPPALPHTALAPSVIWLAPGDCVSTGQDKQHQHHLGTSRSTNSLAPESELQAVQLEQLSQYCGGLGATWGAPHASHSSASGDLGLISRSCISDKLPSDVDPAALRTAWELLLSILGFLAIYAHLNFGFLQIKKKKLASLQSI